MRNTSGSLFGIANLIMFIIHRSLFGHSIEKLCLETNMAKINSKGKEAPPIRYYVRAQAGGY